MEFSYRVLKAYQNDLSVSISKHGLDVSYILDVSFGKINISLIGKRK